jgi:hypothetical protein
VKVYQIKKTKKMGNIYTNPATAHVPLQVTLVQAPPHDRHVPGYVAANQHSLSYTVYQGRNNTVGDLLAMTQVHGTPGGNGIVGFTRAPNTTELLALDEQLHDGTRLYLAVL